MWLETILLALMFVQYLIFVWTDGTPYKPHISVNRRCIYWDQRTFWILDLFGEWAEVSGHKTDLDVKNWWWTQIRVWGRCFIFNSSGPFSRQLGCRQGHKGYGMWKELYLQAWEISFREHGDTTSTSLMGLKRGRCNVGFCVHFALKRRELQGSPFGFFHWKLGTDTFFNEASLASSSRTTLKTCLLCSLQERWKGLTFFHLGRHLAPIFMWIGNFIATSHLNGMYKTF